MNMKMLQFEYTLGIVQLEKLICKDKTIGLYIVYYDLDVYGGKQITSNTFNYLKDELYITYVNYLPNARAFYGF